MFNLTYDKAEFRILNLSDIQLGEDEWHEGELSKKIIDRTIPALIEKVKPDLITLSGDIAWAPDFNAYCHAADYLDKFGIPYAPVWGNHDNQKGPEFITKVADEFLKHPLCVYEKGDAKYGNGNYVINISKNGKILYSLIMIDSHDHSPYTDPATGETKSVWARLDEEQVNVWYKDNIRELKVAGSPESAIIMHIPNYGYRQAWNAAYSNIVKPDKVKPQDSTDGKYWNDGYKDSQGVRYEGICSYEAEDGVHAVLKEMNHTKLVLVGHDHVNNFIINYDGIKYAYSLKCGKGCYWNSELNGGTVITVKNGGAEIHHEFVDVSDLL